MPVRVNAGMVATKSLPPPIGLATGNFTRQLGIGAWQLQWTNGSGGFAAFGANREVMLNNGTGSLRWDSDILGEGNTIILDIESNFAKVGAYRSQDLIVWGIPIATGIAPGIGVVVDNAAPGGKAFYVVTPHGFPAPN